MIRSRTPWREKLANSRDLPRVEVVSGKMIERWGKGTFVIPAPLQVDALMRKVRRGRVTTISDIRAALARAHGADFACPITTGIFASIAAQAAEEAAAAGKARITPYWRTLRAGGELNPKYPGGADRQRLRLEAEGHRVVARGKKLVVEGYERVLARF